MSSNAELKFLCTVEWFQIQPESADKGTGRLSSYLHTKPKILTDWSLTSFFFKKGIRLLRTVPLSTVATAVNLPVARAMRNPPPKACASNPVKNQAVNRDILEPHSNRSRNLTIQ